jgi:hypothetical protein
LTHEIPPQDIIWAGYILYKCCKYFPPDTIFLCVVDPGVGTDREIIIVRTERYYFIAPDNGVLSLIYRRLNWKSIIRVEKEKVALKPLSSTFHGRDIFAPLSAHLSKNKELSEFGEEIKGIKLIDFPKPILKEEQMEVPIIHIDRFGNLISCLEKEEFEKLGWERFEILYKGKRITKISDSYQQDEGVIAIWESKNLLELALPNSSAQDFFNARIGETIKIKRIE